MTTSIKIGFSNSNSLVSRIIRFFSRSNISHTWLLIQDLVGDVDLVMEAVPGGFHIITFEKFMTENSVIEVIDIGENYSEKSISRAFGWMGRRYDYLIFLGMLYVISGRFFGKKLKNPFGSRAINCVESIVYFLRSNQFPGADELDPGSMTPHDLYVFLKNSV
jgi:hypothetical protein